MTGAPRGSMPARTFARFGWIVLIAVISTGCTTIADDVSTHMATHDLQSLDQQITLFEGDLALFRSCLSQRGGTCSGDASSPLPHSAQHATSTPITPVAPGASHTLDQSISALPAGHAARDAHALLRHPVTRQAAALHDTLRGHTTEAPASPDHQAATDPTDGDGTSSQGDGSTDDPTSGITVQSETSADGGRQSTIRMNLHVDHTRDFLDRLSSSLNSGAWQALHGHCRTLLEAHGGAPPDDPHLVDTCRQVAFIRGYLGAYVDHSQFFEVDVQATGALDAIHSKTQSIRQILDRLTNALDGLESAAESARGSNTVASAATSSGESAGGSTSPSELASAVTTAAQQIASVVTSLQPSVEQQLGQAMAGRLGRLARQIETRAGQLSNLIQSSATGDVQTIAADLDVLVGQVDGTLTDLSQGVGDIDHALVHQINTQVDAVNAKLSNVFRVSRVGFVSRESTFKARLPTLDITVDPTAGRLVLVTDADAPASISPGDGSAAGGLAEDPDGSTPPPRLTRSTPITRLGQLSHAGVATDLSGVGTGSSLGAEITRVFLEAVFDAKEGLPAIAPANTPSLQPSGLQLAQGTPTGSTVGFDALPIYEASASNAVGVGDLARILRMNDMAALNTQLIVGRIVSGLGPLSLNNPPLEALITEMVTTTVRKAVEKVTWCWYACGLDVEKQAFDHAVHSAIHDAIRTEEGQLDASLHAEAAKASGWVHREVEKVVLLLDLKR